MAKQYEIDGKVTVTQNATLLRTERENNLFRAVFENRINTGQVAVYNVDCFGFRAVLFRMVPKQTATEVVSENCFRAVLFRMVPKQKR